jgi:hypothetical protein
MSTRHLPMIPVLLAVATVVELAGSVSLITGCQIRTAAFAMFLYTTAVTGVVPQLLGGECGDGGHTGDPLSEKFRNHQRSVDACV